VDISNLIVRQETKSTKIKQYLPHNATDKEIIAWQIILTLITPIVFANSIFFSGNDIWYLRFGS
jgi:hypothetical protein